MYCYVEAQTTKVVASDEVASDEFLIAFVLKPSPNITQSLNISIHAVYKSSQ
jgi:hypothetical protein